MDKHLVYEIANSVVKYKLYPYFNACNYILMSMAVREDAPQSGNSLFSRRHPFACWFATMLMCFASNVLSSFLLGDSVLSLFEDTDEVLLATACWYAVNYCPFDLIYKFNRLPPVKFVLCILKEVQRTKKIQKGVLMAMQKHPHNMIMWVIIGTIKGSAYSHLKLAERLVRGVWLPASNEFLKPTFTTKSSLTVSILFIMVKLGKLPPSVDPNLAFLLAMVFLIYFRVIILILGISDPYAPFENVFCGIFFGGVIDALRNAWKKNPSPHLSTQLSSNTSSTTATTTTGGTTPTASSVAGSNGAGKTLISENGVNQLGGDAGLGSNTGSLSREERKKDI